MTSVERTAAPGRPDFIAETLLVSSVASRAERRLAALVVLASLVVFIATVPWSRRPLPQVWAFIPAYEAALILNDLITAALLVGQFRIARSKPLLLLAGGYFFTALTTVVHGLTFPGVFAPGGLLGAGPQSTAWLYMFWHGGFPIFIIAYVLSQARPGATAAPATTRSGRAIGIAAAATAALAAGCSVLATAGHALLPVIMRGNQYGSSLIVAVSVVWLLSLTALALLFWRRRPHSVLDLWLMVVLTAWLLDVALSALLNGARFDLGFYAGRAYGLLATGFVLIRLLLENGVLYARLVQTHALERERSAELQRLSQRLESTNQQLGESNRQLREQSGLKSEFLANMSHELRTPLNAIIGFSDLLRSGVTGQLTPQQRDFSGHIFRSGHHLLALINDILDMSKIEAGKLEIRFERVRLDTEVAQTIAMVEDRAATRRIRLALAPGGVAGEMMADATRFRQILLNLLSNAIKFSPDGGRVTVSTSLVGRARAASALPGFHDGLHMPLPESSHERFVEVSVADHGIGLSITEMPKLFTPFVQISNAVTRNVEGTGLGLAMVHRLARLHEGTVAVTSAPGRGSCFTAWLPWRELAPPAADSPRAAAPQPAARPLALVIEDNGEAAALMGAQLQAQGFDVRHVGSAEAALALIDGCTPDLITLDILLPGMDGWQFLARIKDSPRWASVPVVVVSVVADLGKGFSLGAALVLQKPIAHDALSRGLERLGLRPGERDVTVLVIDDDAGAVELLATQLRQRQCTVLRALGGREGIELAKRFRPHLIALDLEMPEVNGFDVVEALKGEPDTARIPVIVVTAKDLTAADRQKLNGHILEIVGKAEFNHGRFTAEVQRALSKAA